MDADIAAGIPEEDKNRTAFVDDENTIETLFAVNFNINDHDDQYDVPDFMRPTTFHFEKDDDNMKEINSNLFEKVWQKLCIFSGLTNISQYKRIYTLRYDIHQMLPKNASGGTESESVRMRPIVQGRRICIRNFPA